MGRIQLTDPRVRALVEDELVPLVTSLGSINAAATELAGALAHAGESTPVYPNRLHALLSLDSRRAANESTVELVERAVAALRERGGLREPSPEEWARLSSRVLARWNLTSKSETDLGSVAEALSLSPAVVRAVLSKHGEVATFVEGPTPGGITQAHTSEPRPDWSFQDDAHRRCVSALLGQRAKKIGAVIPTGGGKTRVGLRVVLSVLASEAFARDGRAVWLTHRRALKRQAHRELQRMVAAGVPELPAAAHALLAERIDFIMVRELESYLAARGSCPTLIVVDEAHHAAAASYAPAFDADPAVSALFLTATPNRTDGLPLGIDEIAYSITYRELAERHVILRPVFEDLEVSDFDWRPEQIRDLADVVVTRAEEEYTKTLVIAPRIDRLEEVWRALRDRLAEQPDHPLGLEDIGYVHSRGNSLDTDTDTFLEAFAARPRAILVSAQMLLEGFDDPTINAVVLTYPSESVVVLMQAAGRCVRYAPGKSHAYVLQARNDRIAYHFDQRWLYQEISDRLRPDLRDLQYSDKESLRESVRVLLDEHRIREDARREVLAVVDNLVLGEPCRLLFSGLPYYGDPESFSRDAQWSVIVETSENSTRLRALFNRFSEIGAPTGNPIPFLERYGPSVGLSSDASSRSELRAFVSLLTSMYLARKEIEERASFGGRPAVRHGPTTWLRYVTLEHRAGGDQTLTTFLADCYNREELLSECHRSPERWVLAVKLPLPLGGGEGHLLDAAGAAAFYRLADDLAAALRRAEPRDQFAVVAAEQVRTPGSALPFRVLQRIERFVAAEARTALTLSLRQHGD